MSTKLSVGRVRATYEFIKLHRTHHSVQMMCRVLGVAPNGYYEWDQAADLESNPDWDVTFESPQGPTTVTVSLKIEGDKANRELSTPMGKVPITGTATADGFN